MKLLRALSVVIGVAVLIAAIGCTTTPTPNIDATVEARVLATAQANPTPDIDATLEVKVRSILQTLSDPTSTSLTNANPIPVPVTSASVLSMAWQENEIAAELKYSGKTFVIVGRITKIEKKGGVGEVNLDGGKAGGDVVCKFQASQFRSIATFQPQQTVRVQGEIIGVPGMQNIVVERCTVP